MNNAPHIELRNIQKNYDGRDGATVLQDINLRIAPGELLVIIGRSGSGKSTLLNLIGGLDEPSRGQVFIRGQDYTALREPDRTLLRRREIGFVFQAYNLIPTLSVAENLALPLSLLGDTGNRDDRIDAQLSAVDMLHKRQAFPEQLSGGEQQRVAIARALIHQPSLILADEPTGNLDLETAQQVLALLDTLCRSQGKTLVMATHSREVMGLADRLLSIRDNRLEAQA